MKNIIFSTDDIGKVAYLLMKGIVYDEKTIDSSGRVIYNYSRGEKEEK